MAFEFGDVVLVPFPFTDRTASKRRPAVIVSDAAYNLAKPDIVVMAITSQFRPTLSPGDVWVEQWQAAGLLKAVSRQAGLCHALTTFDHSPTRRARIRRSSRA